MLSSIQQDLCVKSCIFCKVQWKKYAGMKDVRREINQRNVLFLSYRFWVKSWKKTFEVHCQAVQFNQTNHCMKSLRLMSFLVRFQNAWREKLTHQSWLTLTGVYIVEMIYGGNKYTDPLSPCRKYKYIFAELTMQIFLGREGMYIYFSKHSMQSNRCKLGKHKFVPRKTWSLHLIWRNSFISSPPMVLRLKTLSSFISVL